MQKQSAKQAIYARMKLAWVRFFRSKLPTIWLFLFYYCYRISEMQEDKIVALPLNSQPRLALPSTETLYLV